MKRAEWETVEAITIEDVLAAVEKMPKLAPIPPLVLPSLKRIPIEECNEAG